MELSISNIQVGDIVILQEDNLIPTKWPLARVTHAHSGIDGIVCVATVKTSTGVYKRPITKFALLLSQDRTFYAFNLKTTGLGRWYVPVRTILIRNYYVLCNSDSVLINPSVGRGL